MQQHDERFVCHWVGVGALLQVVTSDVLAAAGSCAVSDLVRVHRLVMLSVPLAFAPRHCTACWGLPSSYGGSRVCLLCMCSTQFVG